MPAVTRCKPAVTAPTSLSSSKTDSESKDEEFNSESAVCSIGISLPVLSPPHNEKSKPSSRVIETWNILHSIIMPKQRTMRKARTTSTGNQHLMHPISVISDTGGNTPVAANIYGIIPTRPARARSMTLSYYSQEPRSFIFTVYNGNGEEIFRSPTMLSGPIPLTRTFTFPVSTDFSLFTGSELVARFDHSTNPGIRWVLNLKVEYKSASPTNYF
jgi:hypothetical protein